MDINGWLTVITVFTAIFALIPRADLVLSFYRIKPVEKWAVFFIVVFLIPYLIFFPSIATRLSFLKYFTYGWGFKPSTIAFALFYFSFFWLIARLFWIVPKEQTSEKNIAYFIELLNEQPFEEFFKLFAKYTSTSGIVKQWKIYKQLIFQPKFLKGTAINHPSFLLQFWKQFSNEKDFQTIFRLFLENENSAYYKEIKEHWNTYSLLDDKPFLNTVLRDNLKQSINNGLLQVYSDYVSNLLLSQYDKASIYNQPHYYTRISEDEGYDLPLYYHILFIGFLYSSAIENNVDISDISDRYTNMQSIYSNVVEGIINNIDTTQVNENAEYPTNYHWLIAEMFSLIENWLSTFSEQKYFSKSSSYVDFIPFSFSLCMNELYKGFNRGKITQHFLNARIYYNMLSDYFSHRTNDEMRSSIEKNVIKEIPKEHLKPIFEFALDEKFAMHYSDLVDENFKIAHDEELKALKRLRKFLAENNLA
jgi:hypothetical protein